MEVTEVTNMESRIVFLLATNDIYVEEITGVYKPGFLANKYYSKIAELCISFYKNRGSAPKEFLPQFLTNATARGIFDADTVAELQIVIAGFAKEAEVTDIDFEIEETLKYLELQEIRCMTEEVQDLLKEGKIDEAKELISGIEYIQTEKLNGSDIYEDSNYITEDTLNDTDEYIVTLPGELGHLMNNTLVRNGFVTFMGRNKVGKSHWLIYLARMARNQNRNVIYITAGDMTLKQAKRRVMQADAMTTSIKEYLAYQRVPYLDCEKNQKGTCFEKECSCSLLDDLNNIDPYIKNDRYTPCTKCIGQKSENGTKKYIEAISFKKVERPLLSVELVNKVKDRWRNSGKTGKLHIEHARSGTLTVEQRRSMIRKICKKYGWKHPDLIVVDYADTLAEEKSDERGSTHHVWQSLRADADLFDCLVVTATQANSSAFDFEDLTLRSFSIDRRKFDEVSAAYAINQTPQERQENVWRLAALIKREHPFNEANQAKCYGCLSMGTPHQLSVYTYREPPKPKTFVK